MAEHKMLIPNGANISWQEAIVNKKFDKVSWWHFFNQHKRAQKRAMLKIVHIKMGDFYFLQIPDE